MSTRFFVTGTDTGIGKTYVTATLLRAARERGVHAVGMKPVASGCIETPDGLRSEDALALIDAMSPPAPPYELVNPYALREPLSPHLAAARSGVTIELATLLRAHDTLARDAGFLAVEGVGGWSVPVSHDFMQVDLVRALRLPVVLVVGVRLGCINHALLSARAIRDDGCEFAGWIANRIDPALVAADEAIDTIARRIGPPLGQIELDRACPVPLLDALSRSVRAVA